MFLIRKERLLWLLNFLFCYFYYYFCVISAVEWKVFAYEKGENTKLWHVVYEARLVSSVCTWLPGTSLKSTIIITWLLNLMFQSPWWQHADSSAQWIQSWNFLCKSSTNSRLFVVLEWKRLETTVTCPHLLGHVKAQSGSADVEVRIMQRSPTFCRVKRCRPSNFHKSCKDEVSMAKQLNPTHKSQSAMQSSGVKGNSQWMLGNNTGG